MMKINKKLILKLAPQLFLTLVSGISLTLAWNIVVFRFADGRFTPGPLDSNMSLASFNDTTDTWQVASASAPLSIHFGEMTTIAKLPDKSEAYLKLKMNDQSDAQVIYNVIIEEINILVTDMNGTVDLEEIDYYHALPTQNVFDFYLYTSTSNNLDPTVIFANYQSMTPFSVTSLNHQVHANPLAMTQWTYLMLKPRLASVQNIIRKVPVIYSPYSLVFDMSLRGEVMTIDEN